MKMVLWGGLAAVLLLTGCELFEQEERAVKALRDPLSRPVAFGELEYGPLPFGVRTQFRIDLARPMVDIPPAGRSYANAFALPLRDGSFRVLLTSSSDGGGIFYPMATVLDEKKRVLATSQIDTVHRERTSQNRMVMRAQMSLDGEVGQQARFVVVHTMPDLVRSREESISFSDVFSLDGRFPRDFPFLRTGDIWETVARKEVTPRRAPLGLVTIELAPPSG